MQNSIEFVSYEFETSNLCSGILTLRINGKTVIFPERSLCSGGYAGFDDDDNEYVEKGPWQVRVPDEYRAYKDKITQVVNENVEWGCCGGCI